ncbi:Fibronectin type-III domain-containing protein [Candidatus Electrothrix laxa]
MKILTGKPFSAQLVVLFAAVLCLLSFSTAQAVSNRVWSPHVTSDRFTQPYAAALGTCNARYEVVVTHLNNRPMNKVISFGEFQSHGQGQMSRKAAKRARKTAERCMQTQWYGRQSGMVPSECMNQQRISGYHVQNFQETLKQEICQALKPLRCDQGKAEIRYSIFSVVDGESGCGTRMSAVSRTLLDSGVLTQCKCRQRRQMTAPQQVSPAQGTVFNHVPRRTLVAWQPVPRARSYVVEIKYNGRLWTTLNTTDDATFAIFDLPGAGQGEWRVMAQGRRGMNGPASPWSSFQYQR